MVRYAFHIDMSACTGCKACQLACKDKNALPPGILWRRVVEVSGGDWLQRGDAWLTTVFAYYLSAACMHCEAPICLEICPTHAITQREDGIVLIDPQRCMGCRYCEMACPYKAPQFDPQRGVMTKCNFCHDLLDAGESPACVAACQMRVLHYGDLDTLRATYGDSDDIFPLPSREFTRPALVVNLHRHAVRSDSEVVEISNLEEI
jgi:anaerobic dimethyl sulfoxide reductase subunit B (iron-sulfur subunit)